MTIVLVVALYLLGTYNEFTWLMRTARQSNFGGQLEKGDLFWSFILAQVWPFAAMIDVVMDGYKRIRQLTRR